MEKDYLDKSLSIEERKKIYKDSMNRAMNPIPKEQFNPDNFEPLATADEKEIADRKRIVPPSQLPTFGIKPKEIREGK